MATRVRSAETGQFIKPQEAVRHPKTTVTEKIKPSNPPPKKHK